MPPPPLGFPNHITIAPTAPATFASTGAGGLPKHSGNVSVRIDGDASHVFSVVSLETEILTRDPDVPHSPLAWQTSGSQDGAGPIGLESAEALVVFVGFACPANPAQDSFTASAVVFAVDAPATALMTIPISASVLVVPPVVTIESRSSLSISPGSLATFSFRLRSTFKTEVGGTLTCDSRPPSPFSSDTDPAFPIIPPGGTVDVNLPVLCAAGTAVGNYPVVFSYHEIDNSIEFARLVVTIKVTQDRSVSINPSLSPNVSLDQGSSTLCEFRVSITGGPTTFNFNSVSVPTGITLQNAQQSLSVDGSVFFGVNIDVDPQAPTSNTASPLQFDWTVPGDEFHAAANGSITFNITLNMVTVTFVAQNDPFQSGEVQASGVSITFASNGDWALTAHMHDFSTVFGDNFALGFAFNFTDGRVHGAVAIGVLGSSLTRTPENLPVGRHNNDPWVKQNWQKAFPSGGIFKLHHSGDFTQVLSDIGDDFKNAFHEIEIALSQGEDCPTGSDGQPDCPQPGSDGG